MSYRNILVYLDESPAARERLDFALNLAATHGAHLGGLLLNYIPFDPLATFGADSPMVQEFEASLAQRRQAAREDFESRARALGLHSGWAVARHYQVADAISYARGFDLVIAGQFDPEDEKTRYGSNFVDQLLLGAGRPVLVVPRAGMPRVEFPHVAVAWNGSREAARAVADAMPLLVRAEHVTVLTVSPPPSRDVHERVAAPEITELLQRHGVQAEHVTNPCAPQEAAWLVARVQELGTRADLLVSGAYGHSRVSEVLLGGVTRTLLKDLNIPMLMSH